MQCPLCQNETKKYGRDRKGNPRFRCVPCGRTFAELQPRPLGAMRLPLGKAIVCLNMLIEGCSIRSTERLTGIHRDTILDLVTLAGERAERLLEERIQGIPVTDVQCDEIWAFVGMKEKTKNKRIWESPEQERSMGDAYTFVAFERHTKLILTWHLGRRTFDDTWKFTKKLDRATWDNRFQISTDGFASYRDTITHELGHKGIDFAQVIKVYAVPQNNDARYSPPVVVDCIRKTICGEPARMNICTSHVERQNLTIRMQMRRFTRLTNAFSKKRENLKAAVALFFAYYNFCRIHSSIKTTPAVEAGLTDHVWSIQELLAA
jgi:transposase-like protein/IS1 family transposase